LLDYLAENPQILNMPNRNETALGAACQMRRVDIVSFLVEQGAELTLSAACVLGLTERVAAFLSDDHTLLNKGDKRSHNKHPIYFAEYQEETLQLLMSRGAK
jgi:hypothetical protein